MFGSNRAHAAHPDGTTITTTTHTTRTTTPHYPSRTSGFMNRLRPRKNNHLPHSSTHHGTTVRPAKTSRMSRKNRTVATSATGTPARKTSVGDKVSGAMTKLRGSLTGKPGVKAAGTRRMNGTDGRGTRRFY